MRSIWQAVNREHRCPVCDRADWCRYTTEVVHCHRIQSNKPFPGDAGGWLHPISAEDRDILSFLVSFPPPKPRATDEELNKRFQPIAQMAFRNGMRRLWRLADQLGVDVESLRRLQCGFVEDESGGFWTFPEKKANGLMVGITRRLVIPLSDGRNKLAWRGGRRGLFYSEDWFKGEGPVYLPEGPTDVAACLTMGWRAVGRPSNTGGIHEVAKLLIRHGIRNIVVLGERDKKPDGRWPGREGMLATAKALAKAMRVKITTWTPPAKDIRAYLQSTKMVLQ